MKQKQNKDRKLITCSMVGLVLAIVTIEKIAVLFFDAAPDSGTSFNEIKAFLIILFSIFGGIYYERFIKSETIGYAYLSAFGVTLLFGDSLAAYLSYDLNATVNRLLLKTESMIGDKPTSFGYVCIISSLIGYSINFSRRHRKSNKV